MSDLVPARNKLTGALVNVRPDAVDIPGGFFESLGMSSDEAMTNLSASARAGRDATPSEADLLKSTPPKSSAPKRAETKETDTPVLGEESKE